MIPDPPVALTPRILITGRLGPDDLPALAASGVRSVVNHRPDHEEPDQPTSADIEAAALASGVRYRHVPTAGLPGPDVAVATAGVMQDLAGGETLLMFCKSGMRSTAAWAMARQEAGDDPEDLRATAAAAGYNLDAVLR